MKKSKRFFAVLLLIAAVMMIYLPASAGEKSFFWRVSASSSVYLLGSVHMGNESMYPLKEPVEQAFEQSEYLVVEADVEKPTAIQSTLIASLYEKGRTLQQDVPEELFQKVSDEAKEDGFGPEVFNLMKPAFAAMAITQARNLRNGLRPDMGIDMHFLAKARQSKKILELESIDFQLQLLAGLPLSQQIALLDDSLEDFETFSDETDRLIRCWIDGDVDGLEKLSTEQLQRKPALLPVYKKLIDDRNSAMAAKIEGYLKDGKRCFVVVGAEHLIGESGIVSRLRSKGYTVEQQ